MKSKLLPILLLTGLLCPAVSVFAQTKYSSIKTEEAYTKKISNKKPNKYVKALTERSLSIKKSKIEGLQSKIQKRLIEIIQTAETDFLDDIANQLESIKSNGFIKDTEVFIKAIENRRKELNPPTTAEPAPVEVVNLVDLVNTASVNDREEVSVDQAPVVMTQEPTNETPKNEVAPTAEERLGLFKRLFNWTWRTNPSTVTEDTEAKDSTKEEENFKNLTAEDQLKVLTTSNQIINTPNKTDDEKKAELDKFLKEINSPKTINIFNTEPDTTITTQSTTLATTQTKPNEETGHSGWNWKAILTLGIAGRGGTASTSK